MAKKEVLVCDDCTQKLSVYRCEFCNGDLCDRCGQEVTYQEYGEGFVLKTKSITFKEEERQGPIICKACFKKLPKGLPKELIKTLVEELIKKNIVKEI